MFLAAVEEISKRDLGPDGDTWESRIKTVKLGVDIHIVPAQNRKVRSNPPAVTYRCPLFLNKVAPSPCRADVWLPAELVHCHGRGWGNVALVMATQSSLETQEGILLVVL